MNASVPDFEDSLREAIHSAVEQHVEAILQEEAEEACKRVRSRVAKYAGELAHAIVTSNDSRNPFDGGIELVFRLKKLPGH